MMRLHFGTRVAAFVSTLLLGLTLGACGGTSRPAAPAAPNGLTPTAGNGEVSLTWTASDGASGYHVYYATSAGVTKVSGTKVGNLASTSTVVTGLANGTVHYFVVTAFNSGGESAESSEVSAQPVQGDITQASMTGIWRFQAIAAGASPGWMRGTLTVADDGTVTIAPYLDSAGNTSAPAGLFPRLLVDPAGQVRDAANLSDVVFSGVMGPTRRNKVVGTSSSGGTELIALLLKHDPNVVFNPGVPGDINGFGGAAGGARRLAYSQITAGAGAQEWEFAQGQIGANNPAGGVGYTFGATNYTLFLNASGTATRPGDKASILSVTAEGLVTEAVNSAATALPPPAPFVMGTDAGVMSDDKTLVVSTTTDANTGRFVLRIYQMINVEAAVGTPLVDMLGGLPLTFAVADLGGSYGFRELAVGANPLSASGTMTIDGASGAVTFASYADTAGAAAPAGFTLAVDQLNEPAGKQNGILTSADAPSVHGKLGDFKDMLVLTRTDASGASRLAIALK
jgi:hypothetical protein